MLNKIIYILLLTIFPYITKSQIWNNLIIKTNPLRDFVIHNSNISLEKLLNNDFSVEMEFTYKTHQALALTGEGFIISPYTLYNCNGYQIQTSLKENTSKHREISNTFYFSEQLGYSNISMPHLTYRCLGSTIHENWKMQMSYINLLFGRSFILFKHFFTEINSGTSLTYKVFDIKSYDNIENNRKGNEWEINLLFNWEIGYLIQKNK